MSRRPPHRRRLPAFPLLLLPLAACLPGAAPPREGAVPPCPAAESAIDAAALDERPSLRSQPLPSLPSPAGRTLVEARDFVFVAIVGTDGSTCVERFVDGPRFRPLWPELSDAYRAALVARTWTPGQKSGLAVPTRLAVTMKFYPYSPEAAATKPPGEE